MPHLVLHDYWRSSAAYRVRIALALKDVRYERVAVSLIDGAQSMPDYGALNPQELVPTLVVDGTPLTQSLAIVEWIDTTWPEPALLPTDPIMRAQARAMAQLVACDIHPVDNLRVLKRLEAQFGAGQAARDDWYGHWVVLGLAALEAMARASPRTGPYLGGATPGLADICLVPQMYNARRFAVPLDAFPRLVAADAAAAALPGFAAAHPDHFKP